MENRVYLNDDWKFSEQFTEEMLGDGFDVGNMTPVRLPHTVKETPLHYFDESVYQMVSGYRRDVYIPEEWKEIQFGIHTNDADILLNKVEVNSEDNQENEDE